ncbi:hypothetical protein CKAH01_08881 [Colletotrichum kahawae]|uniref:Uncharacterized protein n=1 Tax=Colletotrichum kahawae TaxID=34407 RepID=A0AAD9Y1M0_COLKA|nr:hypothetical protein CKAH01_08881 [Colletotrichum kahawae]
MVPSCISPTALFSSAAALPLTPGESRFFNLSKVFRQYELFPTGVRGSATVRHTTESSQTQASLSAILIPTPMPPDIPRYSFTRERPDHKMVRHTTQKGRALDHFKRRPDRAWERAAPLKIEKLRRSPHA